MHLNEMNPSDSLVRCGMEVLNYQPFVLTNDLQTGAAYSFLYSQDAHVNPPLVFRRSDWFDDWQNITDANQRLRNMYDAIIGEVAERFPANSLLDVACNNGYFPVAAERMGMRGCAGMDIGRQYAASIEYLNLLCGTNVRFLDAHYDPRRGDAGIDETFDVVVASAIMCHLPDPLNFLAFLGRHARKAILFWGSMIDSEYFLIALQEHHRSLGRESEFPYGFNNKTSPSKGLFKYAMQQMGFENITELEYQDDWLPASKFMRTGLTLEEQLNKCPPHPVMLCMK